jgi:3-methyladenine DNA glycosylase AlkD
MTRAVRHVGAEGLVREVRARLAAAADPARADPMRRYMRSTMPFRGVPAQLVRSICREVLAARPLPDEDAWRAAVDGLWDGAGYREERYAAIQLTGHRLYRAYQRPGTLGLYRHLVVSGAWWDLVDPVAGNRVGPILRAYHDQVAPTIRAWAVEDDLWLRRTAILCQLGSKERTDVDLLADVVLGNLEGSLHGREFFVRKAVGWALRQHARTDPDWVRRFVAQHQDRLSGLSRREALKHLGP